VEESPADLQRARALVLRHGWNATSYQIINPGMRLWFTPEGDSVAGYVETRSFRIVAGAPVCALERLSGARQAFEADAALAGKRVCYFCAESRLESMLRGSPQHAQVLLGAQPSFHPREWPHMLANHASLRAQMQRSRNKGIVVCEYTAARAAGDLRIRGCLLEWLATRGLPPLQFLVEPETLERLYDRRIFVAERRGEPVGFLVASPIPQRNGWLIEQLIRGRGAPNGTGELMIAAAIERFGAEGSAHITLGLSPLSRAVSDAMSANPRWLRWLLAWLRAHGRRFYNFDGLDTFKGKFRPGSWDPVFAICNQPRFTPPVLYAIAAAFSGGRPIRLCVRALVNAVALEVSGRAGIAL
jgi:phosphatidylglycerol lysyltransferase